MAAPRTKAFGPARIVALALISVVALGLAYLHLTAGEDQVSVPSGAHAGQLQLHSCRYATENGSCRTSSVGLAARALEGVVSSSRALSTSARNVGPSSHQ